MSLHCREPGLGEMLADSITRAVMEADGVDPGERDAELRQIAALLDATRPTPILPAPAMSGLRGKRGIT